MDINQNYIRPKDKRSTMPRLPKRQSGNKVYQFKLPFKGDPSKAVKYESRTVEIINKKNFRNLNTGKPTDRFLGTIKIF